jgi:hypothetical protein
MKIHFIFLQTSKPSLRLILSPVQSVLGLFSRRWSRRDVKLTTHLHTMPWLRILGAVPPLFHTSSHGAYVSLCFHPFKHRNVIWTWTDHWRIAVGALQGTSTGLSSISQNSNFIMEIIWFHTYSVFSCLPRHRNRDYGYQIYPFYELYCHVNEWLSTGFWVGGWIYWPL